MLFIIILLLLFLLNYLGMFDFIKRPKRYKNENKEIISNDNINPEQEKMFLQIFSKSLLNRPIYFINVKVKFDDNIMYYVDYGLVCDVDIKEFKWIKLKYKKSDTTFTTIKFATNTVFLTKEEANAFLNGEFIVSDYEAMNI